jgi:riboflavin-specific deaminase-like protein
VRILLPEPGETSPAEQIRDLRLTQHPHDGRPYVVLNFAMTADGRAAIGGRAGPIGSRTDTEVLQLLRAQVDAVMIGAGTMRAERYGRMVSDPKLRAWRERIGLAHDPLAVIVSGRLDLPWDAPLFTDGGPCLIFTTSDADPPPTETSVRVVRHEGSVDLAECLRYCRRERGVRALLCEGGPFLHAQLQAEGLVDELFLTIAPKLAGGMAPRILEGDLPAVAEMELVWLLEEEGELFARYRRR